ncbi:hypothetical protein AOZ06_04705 [Kibdelosporangium phytohabitans]|uniref:HTH cro/C1-type domain-containing protein n=1 Tax=Kibdelosporangium phytohabitans TaxID=860235 RepID=A0A0N9HW20_9PSEU|nr:hypothetical protein AOZ06_04705 [Kibdelosporangium phytohabitans]
MSWYTWIEQGRANVSAQVLDAIARVLGLSADQRIYMRRLAGLNADYIDARYTPDKRELIPYVDNWNQGPAYVLDRYWNVITANDQFHTLWAATQRRINIVEHFFTDPHARTLYPLWESAAPTLTGRFRSQASRYPDDPEFRCLTRRLVTTSPAFAQLWAQHLVTDDACGPDSLFHPGTGPQKYMWTSLRFADRTGLTMVVYLPCHDAPSGALAERA